MIHPVRRQMRAICHVDMRNTGRKCAGRGSVARQTRLLAHDAAEMQGLSGQPSTAEGCSRSAPGDLITHAGAFNDRSFLAWSAPTRGGNSRRRSPRRQPGEALPTGKCLDNSDRQDVRPPRRRIAGHRRCRRRVPKGPAGCPSPYLFRVTQLKFIAGQSTAVAPWRKKKPVEAALCGRRLPGLYSTALRSQAHSAIDQPTETSRVQHGHATTKRGSGDPLLTPPATPAVTSPRHATRDLGVASHRSHHRAGLAGLATSTSNVQDSAQTGQPSFSSISFWTSAESR